MTMRSSWLLALAAAVSMHTAALAQEVDPDGAQNALEMGTSAAVAVLKGERAANEVFSEGFLQAVPAAQLTGLTQQLESQFGVLQGVESVTETVAGSADIVLRFEKALGKGVIAVGPDGLVNGLRLTSFEPIGDSPDKLQADLSALPGTTNALLARLDPDGGVDPIFAHNADTPLAIGSTFKLYVLSALERKIAAGELSWGDVIPLTERSFPSGMMQDWPEGAPVTVHTLATMMISISDNTATDQLIELVGREAVEAELIATGNAQPELTLPFLKTREMFALKAGESADLDAYSAASDDRQREMLQSLDGSGLTMARVGEVFGGAPVAIDVEWFASPSDLAGLLRELARDEHSAELLGTMAVNTSMSEEERANWSYVGYKGGSEPGVLNLTWLLRDRQGALYIATIGWNNPEAPLDNETLELMAMRLIALAN